MTKNIPYNLLNNPQKEDLLAMIMISIEKLKDYGFSIQQEDINSDNFKDFKELIPNILYPLFVKSIIENEGKEFNAWKIYFKQHLFELDKLNKK